MGHTVYKSMHADALEKVLNGSLKFGNLASYRLRHKVTGDRFIGDPKDGLAVTNTGHLVFTGGPEDDGVRNAVSTVISIGKGAIGTISNYQIKSTVDGFVCSLAVGDFRSLAKEMNERAGYDACVKINDLGILAETILRTGHVDGVHLSEYYDFSQGEVTYASASVHNLQDDFRVRRGDPFAKDIGYKEQCEYRLFLKPRHKMIEYSIYVSFDVPARLFERVETGFPANNTSQNDVDYIHQARSILRALGYVSGIPLPSGCREACASQPDSILRLKELYLGIRQTHPSLTLDSYT